MSSLIIAAMPAEDDQVWKVSSEKKPHLTILFLGEVGEGQDVGKIANFVHHCIQIGALCPFELDVDYRGELGDDKADVIFFRKNYFFPKISAFRNELLKNDAINRAYLEADQFPEWTPHLTLGYPDKPAKKTEFPINWVRFDRIAVWFGDYEGLEFRLKYPEYDLTEVAMGETVEDVARSIAHHGVKGQRWGIRKDRSPVDTRTKAKPGKRVKAAGGQNQPAHPDAVKAAHLKQKAKKSTTDSLSNDELRTLINRMNLEAQVSSLAQGSKGRGRKFVEGEMEAVGKQQARKFVAKKLARKAAVAAALA